MDDLVSIEEAAREAGVPLSTLRRWLSADSIETFSYGRDRRKRFLLRKDADRLLAPRPVIRQPRRELQVTG